MRKKTKPRPKDHNTSFFHVFVWCLSQSWTVSWLYTLIRILLEIFNPLLNLLVVFVSGKIISVLSLSSLTEHVSYLKYMLFSMLIISLLKVISIRLQTYITIFHSDLLSQHLVRKVMDVSFQSDIARFDDPEYQDKVVSVNRDGSLLVQALSSSLSAISSAIAFGIAISFLSRENLIYAVMILFSSIPSAIFLKKHTESLYNLSLSQINDQRKLTYIQHVAADRKFAQDIRLFRAESALKEIYNQTWFSIFAERKGVVKKSSIQASILEFVPESTIVIISGHIIFRIISGNLTVSDYIFMGGLLTQLGSIKSSIAWQQNMS